MNSTDLRVDDIGNTARVDDRVILIDPKLISRFHLNEIYNNFLFAEFAASAVLPFCFWAVYRTATARSGHSWLYLGVGYGLLIVTHLPLAIIGSLALAVYGLGVAGRQIKGSLLRFLASVLIGLTLSSFYWIKVVTESQFVKHSLPQYFSDIWSYQNNFLFSPWRLLDLGLDPLSLWLGDLMLAAMLLLGISSIVLLLKKRSETPRTLIPILIVTLIAALMATPLSTWIWQLVPVLQKTQFPWRWLSIISLFGSIFAAYGISHHLRLSKESQRSYVALRVALPVLFLTALSVFIVKAPHFTPASEFRLAMANLSDGETFEGWWPMWAERSAFQQKEQVVAGGRSISVTKWEQQERYFTVGSGSSGTASVATFYYPNWKARLDGVAVAIRPDDSGLITMELPEGNVDVRLRFEESPVVIATGYVSTISWFAAIMIILYGYSRRPKVTSPQQ